MMLLVFKNLAMNHLIHQIRKVGNIYARCKWNKIKCRDKVIIPCEITQLCEGTSDFCNVTVQTVLGRKPDGQKESFSAINTA